MFDEYDYEYEIERQIFREKNFVIDNRTWKSNVLDIYGGDNFTDFCEELFEMLDEEEYWES
jgi:hypothetical protein